VAEATRSRAGAGNAARIAARLALLAAIAGGGALRAQERPAAALTDVSQESASSPQQPNSPAAPQKEAQGEEGTHPTEKSEQQRVTPKNQAPPCVEPPPMVRWQEYQGPLKKLVGVFARDVERQAVHPPHYKPGAALCTLELKDKFFLFVQDSFDPVTFLDAGFDAGIDQASDRDRAFGQGASGYAQRFGADFGGQASSKFFKDFAYPVMFSEDPRYYRQIHGGGARRFFHALGHAFVAHGEDGTRMPNYSEWLGTTSAVAVGNVLHPGNKRGVGPAAWRVGQSILQDMGWDVLREFWPEISHKLNLPFRGQGEPGSGSNELLKLKPQH
jgi:hypothetical protein